MIVKKIRLFVLKNYAALSLALLVGLISAAPELLAIKDLGRDYQGIPLFKLNDNLYYIARIQDIIDGHFFANSPAIYEYKGNQSFIPPIGELFYAWPVQLFGVSVSRIIVMNKFLLPAVLFLLTYWLIKLIGLSGQDKAGNINAIAGGLLVVFGRYLIDVKNAWLLISGQIHNFVSLGWTRPVNPITGAVLLLIFLLVVWRLLNYKSKLLALIGGLVLGSMVYYFFSWGIGLAVAAVLAAIYFFKKEFKVFNGLIIVILTSFLASWPYWHNLIFNLSSSENGNVTITSGIIYTRQLFLNKVLIANLLFFLPGLIYEYFKNKKTNKKIDDWWWFCLALLLGGLVALNQQLITGRTVWPYHFVQYSIPLAIIAMVIWLYNFVKPKLEIVWRLAVIIIIFFSLAYGLASGRSYVYEKNEFRNAQRYAASLNWLNKKAERDSVVLALDTDIARNPLSSLVPAFTHANVYTTPWIPWSIIPKERILHNYLILLRLRGLKPEEINSYLINYEDEIRSYFFKDIAMANADQISQDDPYILERIEEISSAYKEFFKKDFLRELKKYRLDYIMSEGDLSPDNKKLLPRIEFIGEFNGVYLYEF